MSHGVNKPPSASPLPIPVLIADKNHGVLDSLPPLLRSGIPGIALSLCSSLGYTMRSLTIARYQVVICGVQFAEAENFLLLKQHRAFQSLVPFIVIAEAQDWALAKCALEQGVEDIIVWPLHKGQLEESIREAMWLYQMRATIAHRRKILDTMRSWQAIPSGQETPLDPRHDRLLLPKQTHGAYQRTIQRIETNLKCLTGMADECERRTHMRAVEHLDLLSRGKP
jgi:FixJ family two-component response regulator